MNEIVVRKSIQDVYEIKLQILAAFIKLILSASRQIN